MDIIDQIDLLCMDDVNEIFKRVIRKGQLKRKVFCPVDTMKAKDGKCVLMSPAERRKRARAAKITGRKVSANKGIQARASRKRAKSMRKRALRIPDSGAQNIPSTTDDKE